MKILLFSTLFLIFSMSLYAQEKTYTIEIKELTLNSVSISWHRTDGSLDNGMGYYGEYGIKGFERGKGISFYSSGASFSVYCDLIPDTEYSLYIRKQTDSENSLVWFEEYNFKTPACNTEISNIKEEMEYANGEFIKDLIDVHITFDDVANFYELEYGLKGFEQGNGTIITSTLNKGSGDIIIAKSANRFSIGNENLQSNTEYDYYIRAKCNDEYGEWSEKQSFATTDVFHYLGSEAFEVYFEDITNKSATAKWKELMRANLKRNIKDNK